MKGNIHIVSSCLKDVLALFDQNAELREIILGDTWHPSSGFVDEKILEGRNRISELLDFDYDFRGLVEFEANIESMKIKLLYNDNSDKEEYEVLGNARDIEILRNKLIEANAYNPNKYEFT